MSKLYLDIDQIGWISRKLHMDGGGRLEKVMPVCLWSVRFIPFDCMPLISRGGYD